MNNIASIYTSMDGRIGRKTWWLYSIGLAVVVLLVEFVVLTPLGLGPMPDMAAVTGGDPAAASTALMDSAHRAYWISFIVYLILLWPIICLGVKRRHDRDNGGLDIIIFAVVALLLNLISALGIGYTTVDMGNGLMLPTPSLPLTILNALFGIFAIYLVVVLGFLKGTQGANQYGPDPLTRGAAVAA